MDVPDRWKRGAKKPTGSIDPDMAGTKLGAMLTPEQIASGGSEHAHQCALFQWVNTVWRHPMRTSLFAVPNGGDRQAHVGASMRAEGVKPGVPDLCWPIQAACGNQDVPNTLADGSEWPCYSGLWLELKVPGRERTKQGGLSDAQVGWLKTLREQGFATGVAYGWQAAAWVLVLYAHENIVGQAAVDLPTVDEGALSIAGLPIDQPPSEEWLRAAKLWYGV